MITLPPLLIKASAGSGKTQKITDRFLSLILSGEKPERILATTFTRKAAGEIRDRILRRLCTAASSDYEAAKFSDQLGISSLTEKMLRKALADFVQDSHRLRIQTLDAFCIQLAKTFCFEIGLPPAWKIADEATRRKLIEESVIKLSQEIGFSTLGREVSLITRGEASRSIHAAMIDAMPQLLPLIRDTEDSVWNWLAQSESPSDSEIKNVLLEISKIVPPETKEKKPMKRWVDAIGKIVEYGRLQDWSEVCKTTFLKNFLAKGQFDKRDYAADATAALEKLISVIAKSEKYKANQRLSAAFGLGKRFDSIISALESARSSYGFQEIKGVLSNQAIFGDLSEVYFRLDSTIGHVLLDEFQDTSLAEWNVIQPMAEEILSKSGNESSFFCVGDGKQAIYGWRGGVSAIFDSLTDTWPQLGVDNSSQSYRSAPEVIDTVNKVFSNLNRVSQLSEYPEVQESWKDKFQEHRSNRPELKGHVTLRQLQSDDADKDTCVLNLAKKLLNGGTSSDIAILLRTNDQVGRYVSLLKAEGIEAEQEGGNGILTFPSVLLVLSLLRLLDHPGDSAARFLIEASPLKDLVRDNKSINRLNYRFANEGFGVTLTEIIREVMSIYPIIEEPALRQLSSLGFQYEGEIDSRLSEFENFISEVRINTGSSAAVKVMTVHQSKGLEFDTVILPELNGGVVNHAMQPWLIAERETPLGPPIRVLPRLNRDRRRLLPEFEAAYHRHECGLLDEALCLLYVAMTRAKRNLHMILDKRSGGESVAYAAILESSLSVNYDSTDSDTVTLFEVGAASKPILEKSRSENIVTHPGTLSFVASASSRQASFISPSEINEDKEKSVPQLFERKDQKKKELGVLIHSVLQDIHWLSAEEQSLDLIEDKNIKKILQSAFSEPEFRSIFNEDSCKRATFKSVVFNELRILVRDRDSVIHGACDRVLMYLDNEKIIGMKVYDFKVSEASEAELLERYSKQLESYQRALSLAYNVPLECIGLNLALLPSGKVIEVAPCRC